MSRIWSIGVFEGGSPLQLRPAAGAANPVLSAADVTDVPAAFVADPFMVREGGLFYMFFEVMDGAAGKGAIGLALGDAGGWRYRGIVLEEPFHLSYPYVFEWRGEHYMVPETLGPSAVRLYRARSFPGGWEHCADLIRGQYADPSVVRFGGRWWLFACAAPYQHDTLSLFTAHRLGGPWREHPRSPVVVRDRGRARPAGRVLVLGDRLLRFAQDCVPDYGSAVRAFEVTALTAAGYAEREVVESPILAGGGAAWNRGGMHHLDPHPVAPGRWLACVDGWCLDGDGAGSGSLRG